VRGGFFVWSFVVLFLTCRVLRCVDVVVCLCVWPVSLLTDTPASALPPHLYAAFFHRAFSHTRRLLYMLNTRNEAKKTVFYSYLACFMNTFPLNMYEFLSYSGFTRRNTLSIFLWLCPRNTWTPIQHPGSSPLPLHLPRPPVFYLSPSSVVKGLWEVFVWGFGVLFLSCVCVGVGGIVLCRCVCVSVTCWSFYVFLWRSHKSTRIAYSAGLSCIWHEYARIQG